MSILRRLVSDTAAYGISSILARLINFLFGFIIVNFITPAEFGTYTNFYAYAGFLLVALTHGMETAYFRFSNKSESKEDAFTTTFFSISLAVVFFVIVCYLFQKPIGNYIKEPTLYVQLFVWMMAFDALAAIPFASLRKQGRPIIFASLKILNIVFFILFNVLFFMVLPAFKIELQIPKVANIFIANIIASILTFLILLGQFKQLHFRLNTALYKQMLYYAMPIMLVGFAGMINEVLDRIIMTRLLPFDDFTNKEQLGIYGFNYKFAMMVTMFLQAYRYAAEPIFFKNADKSDNKRMLATTMKYYVIGVCVLFLSITLFMPLIQYFFIFYSPRSEVYFSGVGIVPVLLIANICLGVYFNISTWYKITDKTYIGAIISAVGALITIVMNVLLVPKYGYWGGAWATLACYVGMVVIGYITEHKNYAVPYDTGRILFYFLTAILLYVVFDFVLANKLPSLLFKTIVALILVVAYSSTAYFLETKKKT